MYHLEVKVLFHWVQLFIDFKHIIEHVQPKFFCRIYYLFIREPGIEGFSLNLLRKYLINTLTLWWQQYMFVLSLLAVINLSCIDHLVKIKIPMVLRIINHHRHMVLIFEVKYNYVPSYYENAYEYNKKTNTKIL